MGNKQENYHPPKPDTGDTAHLVTKGLLSFIPAASELFERFISPPLEKKLEAWREDVGEALRQLEANNKIDLELLQSDNRFISIVMHASTIAMRSYQKEKLTALRNAIINSIEIDNFKEDLQFIFIRFIDELTPTHILLLSFFVKNGSGMTDIESYSRIYDWFEHLHPNISKEIFRLMCNDLTSRGLIRISQDLGDFDDIYQSSNLMLEETKDDLPRVVVPEIAGQFLAFISKVN